MLAAHLLPPLLDHIRLLLVFSVGLFCLWRAYNIRSKDRNLLFVLSGLLLILSIIWGF